MIEKSAERKRERERERERRLKEVVAGEKRGNRGWRANRAV